MHQKILDLLIDYIGKIFIFFLSLFLFEYYDPIQRQLKDLKSRPAEITAFKIRYDLIFQGLNHLLTPAMQIEIKQESVLVDSISEIAQKVKINKNRVKNIFILKHNIIF